jgi:hypothetical protein
MSYHRGYVSLESLNYPNQFVRHQNYRAKKSDIHSDLDQRDATFNLVPGLADPSCVSFESLNFPGHFLRHRNGEVWLDRYDGSPLNAADATFRVIPGFARPDLASFQCYNYPNNYIRHCNGDLFTHPYDNSDLYRQDATWKISAPKHPSVIQAVPGAVISLESLNYRNQFVRHQGYRAKKDNINSDLDRKDATFRVVNGLADPSTISFESVNFPGHFLRHRNYEIWLDRFDGSPLNAADASFRVIAPFEHSHEPGFVTFQSLNYPSHFIRHKSGLLFIDPNDGSQLFRQDATWKVSAPKA